jgi:acylphosphatase
MSEPVARHVTVHGRVQGVNFRSWVRERAVARDVSGWVANRADGAVEAWLQGDAEAVASVERAIGEGPPQARVDRVEADDAPPRTGVDGFARR